MLKKYRELFKIVETHDQAPIIHPKLRYRGIIFTLTGFLIYAFYTVLFQTETSREIQKNHFNICNTFAEFSVFHLFMFLTFLPFCLIKGRDFFKCKKPKLIFIRALFSISCLYFYSLARVWTARVDNSILYSTDAFWLVLILFILGIRFNWLTWVGVCLGAISLFYVYFYDISSIHDAFGGLFGTISGISLAIAVLLTRYLVEKDPPLRIGLYHSLIGFTFFGLG
jgi:hypothetical protein